MSLPTALLSRSPFKRGDRRDLSIAVLHRAAALSLGPPTVLVSAPETEFASPRWSPDGRRIAVERHVRGSLPEIVIVDVATRAVTIAAASGTSRCVSPAWMPDGRRVLFASDRGSGPFRLFAVDLATGGLSRLEGTGSSAQSPDVSADGRAVVYVGYTPDGYDLFTLPLDAARWSQVENASTPANVPTPTPSSGDTSHDYHPWATLAPRYWTPTVGSDGGEIVAGAAVGGADALGRHAYLADVEWASSRARPDWGVSYLYDRWRAALFASASDDTDPFRAGEVRSIELNAGVLFPWKRVRWAQSALAGFHAATDTIVCPTCERPIDERAERRSIRTGYTFNSAKRYGYSVSLEEGWSLTATNELIARGLGSDGNAGSVIADLRGYRRVGTRHSALAARFARRELVGRQRGTTRVHRRRQRPAGRRLPLRRRCDRPGSRLRRRHPWRARRRGQSRLSIPNRAHRAWRRHAPRVRPHRARRPLRRRRPCVEPDVQDAAMPACLSESSCRSTRCWAIRCP